MYAVTAIEVTNCDCMCVIECVRKKNPCDVSYHVSFPGANVWRVCAECDVWCVGGVDTTGTLYCDTCWEYDTLRRTRCFTFAAVYDATDSTRLCVASSLPGDGCAERRALGSLTDAAMTVPKVVVVCRVRRGVA